MRGLIEGKEVHCRTGSLEIYYVPAMTPGYVHCRTGSLERVDETLVYNGVVHCRTGSLEIHT